MCGGISGASTLATLGQFLNSGFSVPESFFGAITTGVGSYFLCSKVANIPDPFEDFKKIYKK